MNAEPAALTQTFVGLMTCLLRALAQAVRCAVTLYFVSVLEWLQVLQQAVQRKLSQPRRIEMSNNLVMTCCGALHKFVRDAVTLCHHVLGSTMPAPDFAQIYHLQCVWCWEVVVLA